MFPFTDMLTGHCNMSNYFYSGFGRYGSFTNIIQLIYNFDMAKDINVDPDI
jgi:hypothetical protein